MCHSDGHEHELALLAPEDSPDFTLASENLLVAVSDADDHLGVSLLYFVVRAVITPFHRSRHRVLIHPCPVPHNFWASKSVGCQGLLSKDFAVPFPWSLGF